MRLMWPPVKMSLAPLNITFLSKTPTLHTLLPLPQSLAACPSQGLSALSRGDAICGDRFAITELLPREALGKPSASPFSLPPHHTT